MFFYQSFVWNEFLSEPQLYQTQPKLSAISQLLLIQFCPNFKVRLQVNFPGPSLTRHNCSGDIYPCNICPGNKFLVFWHERSALQSVAVRRSTGNDVSGPLFSPLFISHFFPIQFSPSRTFLIEGVLGSKNLFGKS